MKDINKLVNPWKSSYLECEVRTLYKTDEVIAEIAQTSVKFCAWTIYIKGEKTKTEFGIANSFEEGKDQIDTILIEYGLILLDETVLGVLV